MFHSFQDILATSDGESISVWSLTNSTRILHIANKVGLSRGAGRGSSISRPTSGNGAAVVMNGSSGAVNAAGVSTASASSTVVGSFSQQNLTYPLPAVGSRVGRVSPDIAASMSSSAHIPGATITSMTWINESYDALLLVGSDDGTVKIWRDTADSDVHASYVTAASGHVNYVAPSREFGAAGRTYSSSHLPSTAQHSNGAADSFGISLASSFTALPDIAETSSGSGMVTSWLQHSGTLVVGGNSSSIHVWDLSREQRVRTFTTGMLYKLYCCIYDINLCVSFPKTYTFVLVCLYILMYIGVDTCTTALTTLSSTPNYSLSYPMSHKYRAPGHADPSDGVPLTWTFAGFADGSIGVFDERVPVQGGRVHLSKEHESWIVSAHLRSDIPELITASIKGTVKFSDLRSMRTFKLLEVQKSPLSAFAVHPAAPIFASGSQAQFIKILTFQGDQLGSIIK